MLDALRRWFEANRQRLSERGITAQISTGVEGGHLVCCSADVRSERYECLIQLWDTGLSSVVAR